MKNQIKSSFSSKDILIIIVTVVAMAIAIIAGLSLGYEIDRGAIVALLLTGAVFAFIHGTNRYKLKDLVIFFLISAFWSLFWEALSINTGFPFGNYHYDPALGIQIFGAPLIITPFYFYLVYTAWNMAHILLSKYDNVITRKWLFSLPIVSSLVMTTYDIIFDPYSSTVLGRYTWHEGGAYFGVPFVNFMGWYLCTFTIFLTFSFYNWKKNKSNQMHSDKNPVSLTHLKFWVQNLIIMLILPVQHILKGFTVDPSATYTSLDGVTWKYSYLLQTSGIMAIGTIVTFVIIAFFKVRIDLSNND